MSSSELVPTQNERTMAALGHALTFVEGGIVGPLILYLVERDKSQFTAFHCLQSLFFGLLTAAVCLFGILPLYFVTCGMGAVLFVPVLGAYFVFEIVAAMKAYEGEWYRLPLVGDLAYQTHNPGKAAAAPATYQEPPAGPP